MTIYIEDIGVCGKSDSPDHVFPTSKYEHQYAKSNIIESSNC